jgi:hypothetical protein
MPPRVPWAALRDRLRAKISATRTPGAAAVQAQTTSAPSRITPEKLSVPLDAIAA